MPPKRRRQDDGFGGVGVVSRDAGAVSGGGGGVALSRSSSLIAFESLERRLSEEEEALSGVLSGSLGTFRTTATLRPFDTDSHSDQGSSRSPTDSSDDEGEDSDDSLLQSFNSSRGSFRSVQSFISFHWLLISLVLVGPGQVELVTLKTQMCRNHAFQKFSFYTFEA